MIRNDKPGENGIVQSSSDKQDIIESYESVDGPAKSEKNHPKNHQFKGWLKSTTQT